MMAICYVGTGSEMIMVGVPDSPFAMGFWLGVTGLFASIYHPVGISWLSRVFIHTGTALEINCAFGALGASLGTILPGITLNNFSWRAA